jgi:hypothetical protein
LLMPALGRVRETAKMVKCTSNLRQIYMATFTYAADYDGRAPYFAQVLNKPTDSYFTPRSRETSDSTYKSYYPQNKWFAEYLGNGNGQMNAIGYCPKGGRFEGQDKPNVKMGSEFWSNYSYGINPDLVRYTWFMDNGHPDRSDGPLNQTPYPATVGLWMDATKNIVYVKSLVTGRHYSKEKVPADEPTSPPFSSYQAYGTVNVVYIDGHIDKLKAPDEIPMWSCHFWRWWVSKCDKTECGYCKAGKCGRKECE